MIGKCPHCKIALKARPFTDRETNEVMLTMAYRRLVENNTIIEPLEQVGYCKLCNAKQADLEAQKELELEIEN